MLFDNDDDLTLFAADGVDLPDGGTEHRVETDGASIWFATYGDGEGRMLDLNDTKRPVDHRMRDFYAGVGRTKLASYCLDRGQSTDWGKLLDWVHKSWAPVSYDDAPLIRAFPMPRAVSPDDMLWTLPPEVVDGIDY